MGDDQAYRKTGVYKQPNTGRKADGVMRINEALWTVEETAAFFGVTVRTLYDWRARNYGPRAKKIGRYLRYEPEEVRRWVASLGETV